jgi:hypothetical protein
VTFYLANGEGGTGRLRRSTDGGATWSAFLAGVPAGGFCGGQCFYDIAVAVHPTNANIVNLGGDPSVIQARSTDGGATFTANAATANGLHGDTHVIALAPSNPSVVYFGSDGGIYKVDGRRPDLGEPQQRHLPRDAVSRASPCTRPTASS